MKIKADDITTLNQIKFGYNQGDLRPGSSWLEVEGITGINSMTPKAFLFDHELGQAWVPKSAVKFEMKIGCNPVEPEYRVYIASWFNWTEKIDLMKQGKVVSDEYLRRKKQEQDAKFEKLYSPNIPDIDIFGIDGKPIKKKESPLPPAPKMSTTAMLVSVLIKSIEEKEKVFSSLATELIKNKKSIDLNVECLSAAMDLFNTMNTYLDQGYNFSDYHYDLYEKTEEIIVRLKKRIKENTGAGKNIKQEQSKDNKAINKRAIDL